MNTLYLTPSAWDLAVDVNGNIAMASDPYAPTQDVASVCRAFQGEVWFNVFEGIPYWQVILGKLPPTSLVKSYYKSAALTVPGVQSPQVFITGFTGRVLTGQIQFTDATGQTQATSF